jgi:succinate dehydrogenase/fumarate reductase flavoprotein subunit
MLWHHSFDKEQMPDLSTRHPHAERVSFKQCRLQQNNSLAYGEYRNGEQLQITLDTGKEVWETSKCMEVQKLSTFQRLPLKTSPITNSMLWHYHSF